MKGDGSLLKIEAKTLMEAAEATAACLAALLKNRNPQSIVLLRDGDSRASLVLETALRRYDLSSAGLTLESSHRPATQILPLFLGLAWDAGRSRSFVAVSDIAFVSHSGHRETKFEAGAQQRAGVR